MTKITVLLIMTTLGLFAQESNTQQSIFGSTVEGYASHLYKGMPVAEAQAASVTFLVLQSRFFPENFPQNQNNLLCQFLKFLEFQATRPVF